MAAFSSPARAQAIRARSSSSSPLERKCRPLLGDSYRLVLFLFLLVAVLLYRDVRVLRGLGGEDVLSSTAPGGGPLRASSAHPGTGGGGVGGGDDPSFPSLVSAERASRESTEAADRAARAASDLVETLDAAREAADGLRRVAAAAAHKKRVADRAAKAAAAAAGGKRGPEAKDAATEIATVRERKVTLDDGTEASFSVFGRSDEDVSVFVLPYDTKRKTFTLVEEFHPGPNRRMVGLVAGMYEPKHGGSPRKAAVWELSEEARLKLGDGSRLVPLASEAEGGFSQDKYSSAHFRPFLALDCVDDVRPRPRDREENIKIHSDVKAGELREMLRDGKLNIPSTAFSLMGLKWLDDNNLL